MEPMQSRHFAEPLRAEEYSEDGIHWDLIPSSINVVGSRYALCIDELTKVDETVDLAQMRVAIGNSRVLVVASTCEVASTRAALRFDMALGSRSLLTSA